MSQRTEILVEKTDFTSICIAIALDSTFFLTNFKYFFKL